LPSVTWKGEANRLRGNHIHLAANAACAFIWDAKLKSLKVWPPKAARSAEAQDFWAAQERLLLSSLLSLFFLEFSERIFSRLRRTFTGLSPLCVCYFLLFWRALTNVAVTYPLLFAIGVSMTPWDKLIAAFNLPNLITIISTVATLMATGGLIGRWLNMYPIEVAIVNACHSGQGGTGDVAILTAANRMQLMPFAQIATRIGGAITVTLVLITLSRLV
jgi:hypothetical protein